MRPMTELERHIRKWMEKAIIDFCMIRPGDRVLVAISGGKDSLSLFHLITGEFVHVTNDFSIEFAHVDGGFPGHDTAPLVKWFDDRGRKLHVVERDIYDRYSGEKKSLCFFCSRQRRRALLETADAMGCNRVALAQHRDDAVESFLMNLAFHREISTMMPTQELFDGRFALIRPFYYITDKKLDALAAGQGITSLEHPCPMEDKSRRIFVRNLIERLAAQDKDVRRNIFSATFRIRDDYLPVPPGGKPPELPPDSF